MNREQIILENIDTCIENTKKFLKEHNKLVRNINKAINGILIINNIKNYYYISACNNDNTIKKISNIFHTNLTNYFNSFNIWFLFPEKELCLIVPIAKLNIIEPAYLWNDSESMTTPEKIISKVWYPDIKQIISTPQIIILKTPVNAIYIGNNNTTLESQLNENNINLPQW